MKITKRDEIIHFLNIPIVGDSETQFKCKDCGLVLAKGYDRIEIGGRGPYIQFNESHINLDSFHFPKQFHIFFDEYLSNCEHKVFLYHQRKEVSYAKYEIGKFYISPELLRTDKICINYSKSTTKNKRSIF